MSLGGPLTGTLYPAFQPGPESVPADAPSLSSLLGQPRFGALDFQDLLAMSPDARARPALQAFPLPTLASTLTSGIPLSWSASPDATDPDQAFRSPAMPPIAGGGSDVAPYASPANYAGSQWASTPQPAMPAWQDEDRSFDPSAGGPPPMADGASVFPGTPDRAAPAPHFQQAAFVDKGLPPASDYLTNAQFFRSPPMPVPIPAPPGPNTIPSKLPSLADQLGQFYHYLTRPQPPPTSLWDYRLYPTYLQALLAYWAKAPGIDGTLLHNDSPGDDASDKDGPDKPPPGSLPISETPWSGNHDEIKRAVDNKGLDQTRIPPDGDVWVLRPNGKWENAGPVKNYVGSGTPAGRRGKDRDSRRQDRQRKDFVRGGGE